ncbi:RidA family protein [Methanolobus chelungpuianus]|nr:RidA family protein [Methanolobus chelungpuianus]
MAEINYINPSDMAAPQGYSHAISVTGNRTTLYIGGQNAVDGKGRLVGKDNLKEQTGQVLDNIEKILRDAGANIESIVKFNIYLLQGQNPQEGFLAFQSKWGYLRHSPVITVLFVAGLGNPDWLVEIDAIAVIP